MHAEVGLGSSATACFFCAPLFQHNIQQSSMLPCAGAPVYTAVLHNDSTGLAHYKPGQRLDPASVPFPRPNSFLEEAAAVATMLVFFG